jgi:DNA polymerase III epsilon subunit-like protein
VLNVSYKTKELKAICTRIEVAQANLGPQPAAELHEFLADAEACYTVAELIEFRDIKSLEGDSLSFSFGTHYLAAFNAVGNNLPRDDDGGIAWGLVRRIMLIEISR